MKPTLAILSHTLNVYSETFIQAHRNLPFNIKFYYGGNIPTQLDGQKSIFKFSFKERFKKKIENRFTLSEYALLYSLKREKVQCVLAEYGTTAASSLEVIKYLNLPLVVHFHGFDASQYDILLNYENAYKKVFDYASFIIVVSNQMKDQLLKLGCPQNKLVLNPYGPQSLFYDVRPQYVNQQFLAIGRFVEKKAPQLTILAFKSVLEYFPSSKLFMVGDGPLFNACQNIIDAYKLNNNIILYKPKSSYEISQLMKDSIAFVQHSIIAQNGDSEGMPVVILEAQAAGLPVISTLHAGIPDVVIENETGFLVEEKDIDSMAKKMKEVLMNPKSAQIMGEAGRFRIKNHFSLEKHLNSLANILQQVIMASE